MSLGTSVYDRGKVSTHLFTVHYTSNLCILTNFHINQKRDFYTSLILLSQSSSLCLLYKGDYFRMTLFLAFVLIFSGTVIFLFSQLYLHNLTKVYVNYLSSWFWHLLSFTFYLRWWRLIKVSHVNLIDVTVNRSGV